MAQLPGPHNYAFSGRQNQFVIAIFCGFLVVALAGYACFILFIQRQVVAHPESAEKLLGRRCDHGFPRPSVARLLSGKMQQQLEAACQDNILRRDLVLHGYRAIWRLINRFSLDVLPESLSPLLPVGGSVVMPRDNARLLLAPSLNGPRKLSMLAERAKYYNGLARRHGRVRCYVFPELGASAWWLKLNPYAEEVNRLLDDGNYAEKFQAMLAREITYSWIGRGMPAAAQLACYFRTDHHWTMEGSWKAYRFIHAALSADSPSLGSAIDCAALEDIPAVKYQGSRAYMALYSGMFDTLQDGIFRIPDLMINIPPTSLHERSQLRANYWNGIFSQIPYYGHYGAYFGEDHPLIQYENPGCAADRNLLVVSDSMDNALEPLLASHYRRCFYVDVRSFAGDLDVFIEQHGIDDLVFIGQQGWILGLSKPLL